ncbi:hypothetical protein CYMTET_35725 [Cymbomonas tetramitiformis]|uniref:Uncharacterized protein n=1 Tax=Cymbomonas tetramitiformis TaxID=36881 RepID=A0AAE0F8N0_9CHLO|nr:hypothetical protein CYMTET_35725 [Cymbomonas tetramitiformis]|eukprot:gene192-332_t
MKYRHTYDARTGVVQMVDALEYPILADPPHVRQRGDSRAPARTGFEATSWRGLLARESCKQIRANPKTARPTGLTDDHLSMRAECVFYNGSYLPYSVDALPLLRSRTLADAVRNTESAHDYNGRRRFGHARSGASRAADRATPEDFIDLGSDQSDSAFFGEGASSENFTDERSRRNDLYEDDDERHSDASDVADSSARRKTPRASKAGKREEAGHRSRSAAPRKKNRRKARSPSCIERRENIGAISCASLVPSPFLCKVVDVRKALDVHVETVSIDTVCEVVLARVEESASDASDASDSGVSLVDSAITHRAPTDAFNPVGASVMVETLEKITIFVNSLCGDLEDVDAAPSFEREPLVGNEFRMTGRARDIVTEQSIKRSLREAFNQYFDGDYDVAVPREVLKARQEVYRWITEFARRVKNRADWTAKGNTCGYWTLLFHEVDPRARTHLKCDMFHLRKQRREDSEHALRFCDFDRDALDAEVRDRLWRRALFPTLTTIRARGSKTPIDATFDARCVKDHLVLLFLAREPKDLVQLFNDRDLASLQHIRDSAGLSMIDLFDSHMVQPITLQESATVRRGGHKARATLRFDSFTITPLSSFDFTVPGSSDARFSGERRSGGATSGVVWVSHAMEMCAEALDAFFGEGGFPGTTFEEAVDTRVRQEPLQRSTIKCGLLGSVVKKAVLDCRMYLDRREVWSDPRHSGLRAATMFAEASEELAGSAGVTDEVEASARCDPLRDDARFGILQSDTSTTRTTLGEDARLLLFVHGAYYRRLRENREHLRDTIDMYACVNIPSHVPNNTAHAYASTKIVGGISMRAFPRPNRPRARVSYSPIRLPRFFELLRFPDDDDGSVASALLRIFGEGESSWSFCSSERLDEMTWKRRCEERLNSAYETEERERSRIAARENEGAIAIVAKALRDSVRGWLRSLATDAGRINDGFFNARRVMSRETATTLSFWLGRMRRPRERSSILEEWRRTWSGGFVLPDCVRYIHFDEHFAEVSRDTFGYLCTSILWCTMAMDMHLSVVETAVRMLSNLETSLQNDVFRDGAGRSSSIVEEDVSMQICRMVGMFAKRSTNLRDAKSFRSEAERHEFYRLLDEGISRGRGRLQALLAENA